MKKVIILLTLLTTICAGCTQNQRARTFGGTANVDLPEGQKLVTATWKDEHLWYLTRPMHKDEVPENYEFKESSSFGIIQGTVILRERR